MSNVRSHLAHRARLVASKKKLVRFNLECEREEVGRWLAEVSQLPGVPASGGSANGARAEAEVLALRVLEEQLEHGELCRSRSTSPFQRCVSQWPPRRPNVSTQVYSSLAGSSGVKPARIALSPAKAGHTLSLPSTTVKNPAQVCRRERKKPPPSPMLG